MVWDICWPFDATDRIEALLLLISSLISKQEEALQLEDVEVYTHSLTSLFIFIVQIVEETICQLWDLVGVVITPQHYFAYSSYLTFKLVVQVATGETLES